MKKPTSSLLIDESPLMVYPTLAVAVGLEEAIFVQQIHWYLQHPGRMQWDDRSWVYNTYEQWCEYFPFWSEQQIQRLALRLERMGIIVSERINKAKHDQRKYYTLNYEGMERFRGFIDVVLESAKRSRSKEWPDYNTDDHSRVIFSIISESIDPGFDLDMILKVQENRTEESSKNHDISETENSNNNPHTTETNSHTDLPVLLAQTGVETEQDESITFFSETSEIKQSAVEQTNRRIETGQSDQQKENHYSAPPKRGPGRPPKSTAQAAMPVGRDTRAVDAPKPADPVRVLAAEIMTVMQGCLGWNEKPAAFGRERKAANEMAARGYTVENIVNHYQHVKATQEWAAASFVSLDFILKHHGAWLQAGKPFKGKKRYTDPAKVQPAAPKPAPMVNVVMASEEFF